MCYNIQVSETCWFFQITQSYFSLERPPKQPYITFVKYVRTRQIKLSHGWITENDNFKKVSMLLTAQFFTIQFFNIMKVPQNYLRNLKLVNQD